MMALTKVQLTSQDVVVFFEIATIFAWLVMPANFELVMHYIQRCGTCISAWIWLGDKEFAAFKLILKGASRH
ncbi:hypothetical protein L195_g060520, partial [Trifolium pratense]